MFELVIALGAGLISFLSPCVLPLIPGYISYISGSSINELEDKKNIILFPCDQNLSKEELDYIVSTVNNFYEK